MLARHDDTCGLAERVAAPRPLIMLENVSFRAGSVSILSDVDLALRAGAPTVLLGPNGSGKTTVL
ncbi:MAG: ATP-binding cassette domain-containing protein, partial [Hyphomicrobiaceae bacterium]